MNFEKVVSVESRQITPQPFQYLQGMQFSDLHTCTCVYAYVCVFVCVCGYCGQFIVAFANWRWNLFALFDLDAFLTLCGAFCRFLLASVLVFEVFFVFFLYFLIFDFSVFILCMLCVWGAAAYVAHFSFRCGLLLFSLFEEKRFSSHFEALVSLQQPQPQLLQLSSVECLNRVLFLAVFALLWWPTKTHWRETLNPAHTTYT